MLEEEERERGGGREVRRQIFMTSNAILTFSTNDEKCTYRNVQKRSLFLCIRAYIHYKIVEFLVNTHSLLWFYYISTIVDYSMSNLFYTHILYIIWFGWVYGISPLLVILYQIFYTYILNIYDLVWLGFMAYQPL